MIGRHSTDLLRTSNTNTDPDRRRDREIRRAKALVTEQLNEHLPKRVEEMRQHRRDRASAGVALSSKKDMPDELRMKIQGLMGGRKKRNTRRKRGRSRGRSRRVKTRGKRTRNRRGSRGRSRGRSRRSRR